jgi:ABC-type nitrate/sulfonate/bicarbonate transport system ATPase subunit
MAALPIYELKDVLLSIEHVSVKLGGKQILRDVNAQVRDVYRPGYTTGQIVGLLGPSGCGKTTILRILAGLNKPDTGSVLVGLEHKPVARGMVGLVSQDSILFRNRTVLGNLDIAARQKGMSQKDARAASMAMLGRFELRQIAEHYPEQLSGGQRQRIAIAQQLLCSDHLLLADEPFAALDYNNIQKTIKLIHEVADADELNTVIVVTHDIPSALAIADRAWIMGRERDSTGNLIAGGRIVQEIDLIEEGLCWRPDVTELPRFRELKKYIEEMFGKL